MIKPTKEELENLYNEQQMSMGQIAGIFGYKTHHPIRNLFIKYGIERRTKAEGTILKAQLKETKVKVDEETLTSDIEKVSILQLKKKYNVGRDTIYKWLDEYGLENNYYKNLQLKEDLKSENNCSAKDLAIKYNVTVSLIKKFKKSFRTDLYTIEETKQKLLSYNYDMNNRGFPKQLFYDDEALYNSVILYTKDHKLTSNKITEKVYRIINDIDKNHIQFCSNCGINQLNFINYNLGYGNSDYKLCGDCNNVLNGVSKISQRLFWEIYNNLINKTNCYFHELNTEKLIYITKEFSENNTKSNKRYYRLDFIKDNKIIEFDGEYYHADEEKELTKDKYLISNGYEILHVKSKEYTKTPEQVIEKCLTFLTQ